jgi:hypothetical protein
MVIELLVLLGINIFKLQAGREAPFPGTFALRDVK